MSQNAREIAAYYDEFWRPENRAAQEEHDFHAFQVPSQRALDWLIEDGGGVGGLRLLEIGPGRGRDTEAFARGGGEVVAIDVSSLSLELARERLVAAGLGDKLQLVVADAAALPFAEGAFDASFSRFVIAHVDVDGMGRELARVIKPGGRAIMVEPLSGNPLVKLYRRLAPTGCRETAPRYVSLGDLRRIARDFPRGWRHKEFYLVSVGALALRGTPFFGLTRALLQALETPFARWLRPLCWVTVTELRR